MSILVGYPLNEDLVGGGEGAGVVSQYQHVAFMKWLGTHTRTGVYTSVRKVQEEDGLQIKGTSFPLQSLF